MNRILLGCYGELFPFLKNPYLADQTKILSILFIHVCFPYPSRGITSRRNRAMERSTLSRLIPPKSKLQPK